MWKLLSYFLFLSVIIYPFSYYQLKLPILFLLIVSSVWRMLIRKKIDVSVTVLGLFIIYLLTSLFFLCYGILSGNAYPGSFKYLFALYILFPIVYFFILNRIPKQTKILATAEKIFLIGNIGIAIVMYLAVLNKKTGVPPYLLFLIEEVKNVDLKTVKSVVKMNYSGISSLVFLFPYIFTTFILDKSKQTLKGYLFYLVSLSLSVYAVLISGRRALIVVFLFAIGFALFFKVFFQRKIIFNKKFLLFFVLILLAALPFINFSKIDRAITSFGATISFALNINYDEGSKESDTKRIEQIEAFTKHIIKKPVLGYGHGASMPEMVRSNDKPWRYEVSYLELIYHTGIVGFILYALGPIWIMFSLIQIIKTNLQYKAKAIAILNGFLCILLTFASNPYLNALDIQWVLYFPVLFILIVNRTRE